MKFINIFVKSEVNAMEDTEQWHNSIWYPVMNSFDLMCAKYVELYKSNDTHFNVYILSIRLMY